MTTWVLLRGLAREARHWGAFPDLLRQQLPAGDRVLTPDLPGNGVRWRERTPASVAALVASLRADLARQGVRGPCVLVALSLGGMLAAEWARQAPADLRGCILVNSSMGGLSPWWRRLRPGCWAPLLRGLLARSAHAREAAIFGATSARAPDEAVIARWVEIARTQPVARRNVVAQLAAAARYRAPAHLAVPVLLLCSRGDRLVAPACSHAMAEAWNAPLRVHPWAGHDLPLDDPRWVVDRILESATGA